jgi:cullin 3
MNQEIQAKLDDFEKLLIDTVLYRGQGKITQQTWMKMYQISLAMTTFEEQEQLADYVVARLNDFMKMWSKRLDDVQPNTLHLAEEFSLFWESIQLYLFAKKNLFQDFFSSYNQEKIIRMAFRHLNEGFFSKHIPRITKTIIYFLNEDRNGNSIPGPQIKRVIRMIYEIGLGNDIDLKRGESGDFFYHPQGKPIKDFYSDNYLKYYIEHFEKAMIEDLTNIYTAKSQEWLQQTAPEFCRIALSYVNQELKRSDEYYNLSYNKVRDVLIDIIINQKYEILCTNSSSGIWYQLTKRSINDLKCFYALFKISVIDKQIFYPPLKKISSILGDFITEQVKGILTKTREASNQEVVDITQEILELSAYVESVIKDAFENDRDIGKESDHFLQQSLNVERKCPIIFADYAHHLLTKDLAQNTSEQDFDQKIDTFFKLINKIYDKDIFLAESRNLLARRLLEKANLDTEKKFLGKMGTDWGLGDQSKMKNMLDDIATSEDLLKDWKSSSSNAQNIDFTIKVLRTSCWPDRLFVKDKSGKVFSDPTLYDYKQKFKNFYINKNQGKNLEWVVNYGTAEIKAAGFAKSYFLLTTSMQMAILLMYNGKDSCTYGEIKEGLGFPEGSSHIWEAMRYFSTKLKILIREKEPSKENEKKPAEDSEKFLINPKFASDRLKINCVPSLGARREERKGDDQTHSDVMKEREFVIDAAIVRIMKSRREMALLDLQQETKKLISLFVPDPKMVKRRIDSLMERDYLERHPEKNNVFIYKP